MERLQSWIEDAWNSKGVLRAAPLAGGPPRTVAKLPQIGPSMGTPRMFAHGGEVLLAVGRTVLAVDAAGKQRVLLKAKLPVGAVTANDDHIAVLLAPDNAPWSVAVAPRAGGRARPLAELRRAPYHRHPLALARGMVCTLLGELVVGAPI